MTKLAIPAFLAAVAVFAWFLLPAPPWPEPGSGGHASHGDDPAALAEGVVLSIDSNRRDVTISHGPIAHLGMPGMTMGFQAGDPALLGRIKPGDRVRFHADVVGGTFTVMAIERVNRGD